MYLAQMYLDEIQNVTIRLDKLQDSARSLKVQALSISPLDVNAFDLESKVKQMDYELQTLKTKAENIRDEFKRHSEQPFFTQAQLEEIHEKWSFLRVKGQTLQNLSGEVLEILKNRNLWILIGSMFNDFWQNLENFIFGVAAPLIKGVQGMIEGVNKILSLPAWE